MENILDFDGVYRFTNATDEDFIGLWNNKEYLYKAGTTTAMIIADEALENIQEIRKRWAYQIALREFYKGREYKDMVKMGKANPSTFNEALLQPWVDECLKPLPIAKQVVKIKPKDNDRKYKGSKAIAGRDNPNIVFKDEPVSELGQMSGRATD